MPVTMPNSKHVVFSPQLNPLIRMVMTAILYRGSITACTCTQVRVSCFSDFGG